MTSHHPYTHGGSISAAAVSPESFLMSDSPSVIDNAPSVEPIADQTTAPPQPDAGDEPNTTDSATDTGTESTAGDAGDNDHEPDPAKLPKGVQKRIDKLTQQRYEREARIRELEAQISENERKAQASQPDPDPSQFNTWEEYLDAKVEFEAGKKVRDIEQQRTIQQKNAERFASFNDRADAIRQANPDYDAVLQSAAVNVSQAVMETILESDDGPAVAYHLAKNPTELYRLNAMSERQQVLELGRISARLSAKVPERKVTQAPPPAPAVKATGSGSKSVSDMTDKEYADFRKRQDAQRKRR
jgi:hypothetical protein